MPPALRCHRPNFALLCAYLKAALREVLREVLGTVEDFTASAIEPALQAWADEHAEGNFGAAGMPLRVAVTGGTTSPPLPDTLAILGKVSVLRRIERCLACAPDFAS